MALEPATLHRADAVAPEAQRSGGRDARVLLAEAASRGVARVGERLLSLVAKLIVQLLERLDREVDLATNLQDLGMARAP